MNNEKSIRTILGITIVLVIMNTMMFNLALPKVAGQFALSPSTTSWIVTGYSIVFAIASITYSRLSDFIPIHKLFTAALLLISIGSVIGIFSNGFDVLLGARLIQAAGAGAIPSLGMVLLTRYIPVSRRGRAMSGVLSSISLGLGLGPVVGGFVVQYLGWHFLFGITGLNLVLIPFFYFMLPREKATSGSFDFIGAILLGSGTTGLLLFLTNKSFIALIAGLVVLILFAIRIRTAANPFVMPALFRERRYLTLVGIGIGAYMVSFSFLFIAPQLLSHVFSLNPGGSGLVLFPGAILAMVVSNRVGLIIDRYGNKGLIRYAPLMLLISIILMALTAKYSYFEVAIVYILISVSFTAISSAVSNELSRMLPKERVGSGMGLFQLLQFFSGAFGVALSGSALVWQQSLPQVRAFDNIIWGLTVISMVSIISAWLYRKFAKVQAA
ncbi:DHA2 family metal-tetracycline-proton antiporter-like MFS transporter [Paenibacillus taihuensis]|uniref:DHA2 family metal-tetracycline-proton antiporter-like MFS transporter n=1 Tax=Paenibacillus taihuensis TaxID=1156355 RepID=A0A3D9SGV8_9BACL|nr:MFS transporter [Paenibacillus taihuensis]REE89012.1 DHA2 family metal-tetracycline-proton antiporter-like MFS transporter [Paenibacillus taihuensis]